ncbi:hypothetical protein Leryth_011995 [Lithospermum erythrorhizon]|uniref:Uncharacterized protein n=1 Tax=Lithospermum erythrorhizon TaxID=34254 RepID=A0AAV3RD08_LITER|nr:hypothetical protein Leryth_011995 [Lithospermum erythrorhizon]
MNGKLLYVYASSRPSRIKRLTSNFPISFRTSKVIFGEDDDLGYCEASNKINNNKENDDEYGASIMEERAPSTAEEFIRVAEEKAHHNEEDGLASQRIDKAKEAAGEAATASAMDESVETDHVKDSFKEAHDDYFGTSGGNFKRKGDEEEPSLPRSA